MTTPERGGSITEDSRRYWNTWNATWREGTHLDQSMDQATRARYQLILDWTASLRLDGPRILEVACGAGWLAERLRAFGTVTGTDLADEVIARAQIRYPQVTFVAADFYTLELPRDHFDLLVSVESIAHVPDQSRFVARMAEVLKPGGYLILGVQNRFVLERWGERKLRTRSPIHRWLTPNELKALLAPWFETTRVKTLAPAGDLGVLRFVNSYKLNALLSGFMSPDRLQALKERLGFGQHIVLLARRRR